MAHNGGKRTKSYSKRNCKSPSGKRRDNWREHKLIRAARLKRRLERRKAKRGGFSTKRAMLRFARFGTPRSV